MPRPSYPTRLIATAAAAILLMAQPAYAQSELRDAETESLFHDMASPLIVAAGLSPRTVKVVLLNDPEINAFVAGGQTVYVNSGLIEAADNINEVQGVVAHELGHVADGHVAGFDNGARPAMGIMILSLVLGIAAAAAGSGEGAAGILSAGQQAATGRFLAFSRTQEATADATGAKFLREAGISGRGMLSFFKKLQSQEYRYGDLDPYMQNHPLTGERIQALTADLQASPAFAKPTDPALQERFLRVKAKLVGYVDAPRDALNKYPESDQSLYAHYARAYAYHRLGEPDRSNAEVAALLKAKPDDPYFLEVQGQILLEAGKPGEAIAPLKEAVALTNAQPLIATTYGHALLATEKPANYPEATRVLRSAVARDDDNPFAWLQLGTAYEASGDEAHAALAGAEQASLSGDTATAAMRARVAMAGLTPNSSDWIRAQDIAMTSQNDLDDQKHKK